MILEQKLNKYKQVKEDLGGVCAAHKYNRASSAGKRRFLIFPYLDTKIIFSIIVLHRFQCSWGGKRSCSLFYRLETEVEDNATLKSCVWIRN